MSVKKITGKPKRIRKLSALTLAMICTFAGVNIANATTTWGDVKTSLESGQNITLSSDINFTNSQINAAQNATFDLGGYNVIGADFNTNAIQASVNQLNIQNGTFKDFDRTTEYGSVIHLTSDGNLTLTNLTFDSNSSIVAGAITEGTKAGTLTITDSIFKNNTAQQIGAVGVYKNAIIQNTKFISNSATGTDPATTNEGAGALFLGSVSTSGISGNSISDSSFENNTSGSRGGAISTRDFAQGNNSGAKLDITNTAFTGNIAATNGGAFDNYFYNDSDNSGAVKIANSTFTSNQAANGGAIANHLGLSSEVKVGGNVQIGAINISDTTFTGNTATAQGGAIYNQGTLTLTGTNVFAGNTANSAKNDIYNSGTLNLNGTTSFDGGISGNGTVNLGANSVTSFINKTINGSGVGYETVLASDTLNVTNGATIAFDFGDEINVSNVTYSGTGDNKLVVSDIYASTDVLNLMTTAGDFVEDHLFTNARVNLDTSKVKLFNSDKSFTVEQGVGAKENRILIIAGASGTGGLKAAAEDTTTNTIFQMGGSVTDTTITMPDQAISGNLTISGDKDTTNTLTLQNLYSSLNVGSGQSLTLSNVDLIKSDNNVVEVINNGGTVELNNSSILGVSNSGTMNMNYTSDKTLSTSIVDNGGNGTTNINVGDGANVNISIPYYIAQDTLTLSGNGHLTMSGGTITADVTNRMTGNTFELRTTIDGDFDNTYGHAAFMGYYNPDSSTLEYKAAVTGQITNTGGTIGIYNNGYSSYYTIESGITGDSTSVENNIINIGGLYNSTDYDSHATLLDGQTIANQTININNDGSALNVYGTIENSVINIAHGTLRTENVGNIGTVGNTIYNTGGTLELAGTGTNNNAITGAGTTRILGAITQANDKVIENAISIYSSNFYAGALTTNADNIGGAVELSVNGSSDSILGLTGGTLTKAISVAGSGSGKDRVNITGATTLGTGSSIAADAVITIDSALTVDGGELTLSNTDNLNVQTTLTSGILNIIEIDENDPAGITANGGTLNISGDYTILNAHSSIADAVTTNINGMVEIKGATVALNTGDGWNSDVRITSGNLTLTGRDDTTDGTQTYAQSGGKLTLNNSSLALATNASSITDGEVDIENSSSLVLRNNTTNYAKVTMNGTGSSLTLSGQDSSNTSGLGLNDGSRLNEGTLTVGDGSAVNVVAMTGDSKIASAVKVIVNSNAGISIGSATSELALNAGTGNDTWAGAIVNLLGGTITLDGFTGTNAKSGIFVQSATTGSTTVTNGFDLNNASDNISAGTLTVSSGNLNVSNGSIAAAAKLAVSAGDMNISGGSVSYGGTNDSVYGKIAQTGGELYIVDSTFTNLDVTGGELEIQNTNTKLTVGDGASESTVSSILTGDSNAKINIELGTILDIKKGGSVTLDGGADLSRVTWAGDVTLNGGSLTLAHIVDQSRAATYNKSGKLTANTGTLSIDNTTVLLGNGDLIDDAVKLILTGDLKIGKDNTDVATVFITGGTDKDEWTLGTVNLYGNGLLTLTDISTGTGKSLNAAGGTLTLKGSDILNNANDTIAEAVTTTISSGALLDIQNGSVALDSGDNWSESGSINLSGENATLSFNVLSKSTTSSSKYNQTAGTLTIKNGADFSLNTSDSKITGGTVNLSQNGSIAFSNGATDNKAKILTDATANGLVVDASTLELDTGSLITKETETTIFGDATLKLNNETTTVYLNSNDTWGGKIIQNNDEAVLYYDGLTSNGKLESSNGEFNIGATSAATLTVAADSFIKGYNSTNVTDDVTVNLASGSTLAVTGGNVTLNLDPITSEAPNEDDVWNGAITMSDGTLTVAGLTSRTREDETSATKTYNQTGGTLNLENAKLTLNSGSSIKGGTVNLDPSTLIFQNSDTNHAIFNTSDSSIIVGNGTGATTLTLDAVSDISGTATVDVKANSTLNSASDYIKVAVTNNGTYNLTDGVITANITGDDGTLNILGTGTTTNTAATPATITQKSLTVASAATFDNDGDVTSSLTNSGTITGDGSWVINGNSVNNYDKSITQKSIKVNENVTFENLGGHISAAIDNYGTIDWAYYVNTSVLTMTGNSINHTGAEINQDHVVVNPGVTFTNDGYMQTYLDMVNKGTIVNNGSLDLFDYVQNSGTINTSVTSDHFYVYNPVQNSGIFNITGGDKLVYDFVGLDGSTTGVVKISNNASTGYDPATNVNMHIKSTLDNNTLWLTDHARDLTFEHSNTAILNSNLRVGTDYFGVIDLRGGSYENLNMKDLTLESSGAIVNVDSDLLTESMNSLYVTSFNNSNAFDPSRPHTMEFISNLPVNTTDILTKDHIELYPVAQTVESSVKTHLAGALNVEQYLPDLITSPIHMYKPSYDRANGIINVDHVEYNPSVLAGSVGAQVGAYLTQVQNYEQAFANMDQTMSMTKAERTAMKYANKYASSQSGVGELISYVPTQILEKDKGIFVRPYASFENVRLKDGPKVGNTSYGSLIGGESDFIELPHGWDLVLGGYVGYNGSHQTYEGLGIYQNGGTLGWNAIGYKGNFFAGFTSNVGASGAEASTMYGRENFALLTTGAALKTGYNWELFEGKFIVQPSYMMSYTFVNTFDYTNAAGVDISSDPLHSIQIIPGLKFIGNLPHGWQPYLGVQMIWNIMDQTKFSANDVALPEMSVDPYVQYGVGVQKRWGERCTGYAQAMMRNGGRNGVALSAGFRWALGKDTSSKGKKKTSSMPEKNTKLSLSSIDN